MFCSWIPYFRWLIPLVFLADNPFLDSQQPKPSRYCWRSFALFRSFEKNFEDSYSRFQKHFENSDPMLFIVIPW